MIVTSLCRHIFPMVVLGLGVCFVHDARKEYRERMRRVEELQEKTLDTLKEIRDELKAKKS